MKVVNTIKLKEEADYEILYKKMEREVDQLTSEMERQQKLIKSEKMQLDKKFKESERSFHDLRMTSNIRIEVSFIAYVSCFFVSFLNYGQLLCL
jgi:kinesin family member 5